VEKKIWFSGVLSVLALLGWLTWREARFNRNPQALWRETLRQDPESYLARKNLGDILSGQGRWREAAEHYRLALEKERDFPDAYIVHNNLGFALASQGEYANAIAHYREALKLAPDCAPARGNLAIALKAAAGTGRRKPAAK